MKYFNFKYLFGLLIIKELEIFVFGIVLSIIVMQKVNTYSCIYITFILILISFIISTAMAISSYNFHRYLKLMRKISLLLNDPDELKKNLYSN